ncbi:MAG: DUF4998 domain-containing protein [Tannerella sp.]|nr:DUF4998 domain-containing protein [Tannerella sp.]
MKYKVIFIITCAVLFCSCEDMHEKTEKYYGEIVYPAKYDTVVGHIGYERVEIDLLKAGRVSSEQIRMGKAKKTVIEYDEEKIVLDQLVSWVNVTGLTQSKIYRFFIYTLDEYENKSVPQEIALIPFTASDLQSTVISSPRITTSPSSAIVEWPAGLNSLLLTYHGLTYEYTDRNGNVVKGERGDDSRFFAGNLETGRSYTVKMKYKVLPKVNNASILDTLVLEKDLILNIPASTGTFSPSERDVLTANGLTRFDFESASRLKKLVYPIHANSLQDIFYFSNIEELDLTGGDLFTIRTYTYDRNNAKSEIGGGRTLPFISKVGDVGDVQVLKDLLESGTLKKVRYTPGTMGLDALLAPYVDGGVVELVKTPDEALIPFNYGVNGLVQDGNFETVITLNPSDAPAGTGLENVFKAVPKKKSSSLVFAVPPDYRFNSQEYKYFKYRIYAPAKSSLTGTNANFQSIWLRFMNHMWAFGGNSTFGQEYWDLGNPTHAITDSELQRWTEYTVDISNMASRHTRVIVFNIGGEKGADPDSDMSFYFANFRLTKEK